MKVYCIEQRYYDNGSVTCKVIIEQHKKMPQNTYEETPRYDRYRDYFATEVDAREFCKENGIILE